MQIIAHRGASKAFPENSLLAFEQALLQGCDGIEFDVQYHQASGEFILLHDQYLATGEAKVHFNDLPLSALTGDHKQSGYGLCTLAQALECIKGQCWINIELKSPAQGEQLVLELTKLSQVISCAKQHGQICDSQIVVSSFNHHALLKLHQLLPKITTAALIACCPLDYAAFCLPLKVQMLNLSIDCLNPELIQDAKQRGLSVGVYTVDLPAQIELCMSLQVDAIFTNDPRQTRAIVEGLNKYG
ncbi:glycerophosphoryl diester phosphodiesterase [Colwellia chukchiensis]|uniref:Glycerophosphoryl diester phosphodiesterase n=1 Tax=Colwellia chukchiensis TaxID=641665 RepID=A0A1H7T7M6_9GAMM|nr:glycerophosphodiester phosphodiesterase [Colwellia chukchiensis]SEL80743.1 glycerophosphoryl diester phosphodiesterase [Colwellia chukchiensis]